jgi:hypothetical protein
LLQDVFGLGGAGASAPSPSPASSAQPVYIVELGAGSGKLGYLVVEGLLRYRAFFPPFPEAAGLPFRYVLTDISQRTIDGWLAHPWHFASAALPLWTARQRNASALHVPRRGAGALQPEPRQSFPNCFRRDLGGRVFSRAQTDVRVHIFIAAATPTSPASVAAYIIYTK